MRHPEKTAWESGEIIEPPRICMPTSADGFLNIDKMNKATRELDPEKKLMVAVLEEAVDSFASDDIGRHEAARAWLEEGDSLWPFCFVNICESLGFDPDYVRKGIESRPAKAKRVRSHKTRQLRYTHRKPLRTDIPDIPGQTYSHKYAECREWMTVRDCNECKSRYDAWYFTEKRNLTQLQLKRANEKRWSKRREKQNGNSHDDEAVHRGGA